jgi:hypothetical protein
MYSTTIIVWTAMVVLAGFVGLGLIAGLAVDFVARNRPVRLARQETIRSYYGRVSLNH